MDGKYSKTLMTILQILKQETDAGHTYTQKQIQDRLQTFNPNEPLTCDRRSVKANITALQELGFPIYAAEEISRMVPDRKTGELYEDIMQSGFYYESEFDDSELRILIDGILFSKYLPDAQCRKLIEKIKGLSNRYFNTRVSHISTMPNSAPQNKEITYTIEVLDEAITKNKKVKFSYYEYQTDKKLHRRTDSAGKVREYIINPYQIAVANSRYYLICNVDKYDDEANFRVDRITGIQMLDEARKPMNKVKGLENGLNLPKHMAEHLYMFSGESAPVTFRMKKYILNDVMDWFGNEISFYDETEEEVTASVYVNLMAMRHWAVQYAAHTRILSPNSLKECVISDLKNAIDNYTIGKDCQK